ncbi:MAG: TIGR00159 family protein [Flavobacteriales bacterium]|nr:TIGR00159 family protein [Flavobacteriales bacterium]
MLDLSSLLFISVRWLDILDILVVSIILYQIYKLIKGTVAIKIFVGVLAIYLFWKMAEIFNMQLLSEILGKFIGLGMLALIIVFQQEIRRFLLMIGNNRLFATRKGSFFGLIQNKIDQHEKIDLKPILEATKNLSKTKTGALIVLDLNAELKTYIDSGEKINAKISSSLVENIFFKNSPLHDGGVIIQDNLIKAARCILPISDNHDFPSRFGLRHRSAAGITESTQALAIIVSEETGKISLSKKGDILYNLTIEELERQINKEL